MPTLRNPRHEVFAQELAKGKSGLEAHELAGYRPDRGTASKLQRVASISQRVREILAEREEIHQKSVEKAIERTGIDRAWVLTRLQENVERAMVAEPVLDSEGEPIGEYRYEGSVANRALELLGKELGMFINRTEVKRVDEFANMTEDQLRAFIREKSAEIGEDVGGIGTGNGTGIGNGSTRH